jgi:hypothetical protein
MTSIDIFNSIFNPACSAMATSFNQLTGLLGVSFDFNQVCTSIGDLFRSLITSLGL